MPPLKCCTYRQSIWKSNGLIVPPLQATGSVPDPEGLHHLPAGRRLLPGSGSSGCGAAHAHACRGEAASEQMTARSSRARSAEGACFNTCLSHSKPSGASFRSVRSTSPATTAQGW